jgi:hypothetical protein
VEIDGRGALGDHVFSLLEDTTGCVSSLVPGRPARRWMCVTSSGRRADAEKIASRLRMNPEFAAKVYGTTAPVTTVIITDQPGVHSRRDVAILESLGRHRTIAEMIAAPTLVALTRFPSPHRPSGEAWQGLKAGNERFIAGAARLLTTKASCL